MNKTINLSLCAGTTCYLLGGKELLSLEERLPSVLAGKVKIEGSNCLGLCKTGKPPFVKIDGDPVEAATEAKVIELLLAKIS